MFQSHQYDSNLDCLRDPQCVRIGSSSDDKKRSSNDDDDDDSNNAVLLTCTGRSTLFDGIVGRDIPERPENTDLLRHYTWRREILPNPYVAMSFNPPLQELPNVTLYLYREGKLDIRAPEIRMCFSRSITFSPCENIQLPKRPSLKNGVVVWPVTLLTNATSVRYLRIDLEYDNHEDDQWIFLSEIRVAERLQGN